MCFKDCFDDEGDHSPEHLMRKEKRRRLLTLFYYFILFSYGLAILILSLMANSSYKGLPYQYEDLMNNWNNNPIVDIQTVTSGACASGYEFMFSLEGSTAVQSYWSSGSTSFQLCVKRLSGYSFADNYPKNPKCDSDEKMCGGTDIETKFCVPSTSQCPINDIKIVNSTQYNQVNKEIYQYYFKVTNNYALIATYLGENLPISDIRITLGSAACDSSNTDYQEVYAGAQCGSNDPRYSRLDTLPVSTYASINSQTDPGTGITVGLYTRPYITWSLYCREHFLASRALRAENRFDDLDNIQFALIIASAINLGIVGCLYGLIGIIRMLTKFTGFCAAGIDFFALFMKLLVQTGHTIILLLAFSFAIDQRIFFERVLQYDCSDSTTQNMFRDINNNVLAEFYFYDLAMFIIFVVFTTLECLAFYVCLHNSLRRKKHLKFLKYQNNSDHNSNISFVIQPGFHTQIQKQDPNKQPLITQELVTPIKPANTLRPPIVTQLIGNVNTPTADGSNQNNQNNHNNQNHYSNGSQNYNGQPQMAVSVSIPPNNNNNYYNSRNVDNFQSFSGQSSNYPSNQGMQVNFGNLQSANSRSVISNPIREEPEEQTLQPQLPQYQSRYE